MGESREELSSRGQSWVTAAGQRHSLTNPCTGSQRCNCSDFNRGNGQKVRSQRRWKHSPGERLYNAHCTRKPGRKLTALRGNMPFLSQQIETTSYLELGHFFSVLCGTENLHGDLLLIPVSKMPFMFTDSSPFYSILILLSEKIPLIVIKYKTEWSKTTCRLPSWDFIHFLFQANRKSQYSLLNHSSCLINSLCIKLSNRQKILWL